MQSVMLLMSFPAGSHITYQSVVSKQIFRISSASCDSHLMLFFFINCLATIDDQVVVRPSQWRQRRGSICPLHTCIQEIQCSVVKKKSHCTPDTPSASRSVHWAHPFYFQETERDDGGNEGLVLSPLRLWFGFSSAASVWSQQFFRNVEPHSGVQRRSL